MLFTSLEFVLLYVPVTLAVFFLLGRRSHEWAIAWLLLVSLLFYAKWNAWDLAVLIPSVVFNFLIAQRIVRSTRRNASLHWLWLGVAVNLLVLAYFKYLNFLVSIIAGDLGPNIQSPVLVQHLPLGISFFTFTQIAFLVDAHRREAVELNGARYGLFATYFPHLIAGPILHHKQMMPQFNDSRVFSPSAENISQGLFIFLIGLLKKVILADSFSEYSGPIFDSTRSPEDHFGAMWVGAICYTLQLYFDFSGYSDMAIGVSLMFGIILPINFNSPYKARSIIDFWRRWHMTLSTFLRDYLYIPLGGNKNGETRRYINLFTTMALGGLWHGASWNFVIWGCLHGTYLSINHLARTCVASIPSLGMVFRLIGWPLTLVAVVVAWVFFRATSLDRAWAMLLTMSGARGVNISPETLFGLYMVPPNPLELLAVLLVGGGVALFLPNTQEIVKHAGRWVGQSGEYLMGGLLGMILLVCFIGASRGSSEFIYFNF